ncbi:uncharacterized protein LOC143560297 [Bidens hawaiensis]|uniref:uncharacterized protein LOC143560297 n=1 Tax=Bidens hawaiensis TaxID=980011 RepID=UPI004049CAB8
MESSSRYIPKTFKKRVFRGSSLSYAEPNVIEIDPPSAHQSTKTKARSTQKEVEIINLDIDEDCNNVVFLGGNINAESNKKMKGIMGISLGSSSASKLDAKKAESNNKGKEVLDSSKSFDIKSTSIFDLDDYVSDDVDDLTLQAYFDNIDLPAGIKDSSYTLTNNSNNLSNNNNTQVVVNSPSPSSSTLAESSSSKAKTPVNDDALEKYQRFKKFDTVMDHSDHHYAMTQASLCYCLYHCYISHYSYTCHLFQPHQKCAKSIQEEWRILENDLPDTIFVRVYESRMDLLRVVIIGAEGTPYHDGLFFFDVCFPSTYPDTPPVIIHLNLSL